ncbi:MAG: Arc family DNA-binding protein [Clostridiales bacterium]|nr:Arc family DNA-binding protein [Clostridiales bacterium]
MKTFTLRVNICVDPTLLDKMHFVSEYEGRSVNQQLISLMKNCIAVFEAEHGLIKLEKSK